VPKGEVGTAIDVPPQMGLLFHPTTPALAAATISKIPLKPLPPPPPPTRVPSRIISKRLTIPMFILATLDCPYSRGYAIRKYACVPKWLQGSEVRGAKVVAAPLGHGRARPGHLYNLSLCHPDRDRRDKPGDDATGFAPVTERGENAWIGRPGL
jgi:hypothetical protein